MSAVSLVGKTLGQYILRELIGMGGMGAVYLGEDPSLNRRVAIKVIQPTLTDPNFARRFDLEAKTAAALDHPHIVKIFGRGADQGFNYIVMPYLSGGTLTQRLRQHAENAGLLPSLGETSRLLNQIASALDYAHNEGVIHRDVKTSNIMFDNHGGAYLVDFGIAKLTETPSDLTGTGLGMGSIYYMAPEQVRGKTLTPAADQYALAVVIYAMVTGRMPFEGPTPFEVQQKHINEMPTPPHTFRANTPEAVTLVLERALAKEPTKRFASMTAFAQAFEGAIAGQAGEPTGFFNFKVTPSAPQISTATPSGTPIPAPIYTKRKNLQRPTRPLVWIVGLVIFLLVGSLGALVVCQEGRCSSPEPTSVSLAMPTEEATVESTETGEGVQPTPTIMTPSATATTSITPSPIITVTSSVTPTLSPTATPNVTPSHTRTATNTPLPPGILYKEDFEDGQVSGFTLAGFNIEEIAGDLAYCGKTNSPIDRLLPQLTTADYSLEAKVMLQDRGPGPWWVELWGRTTNWTTGYALFVDGSGNRYERVAPGGNELLGRLGLTLHENTWYVLRLDMIGNRISAFINGQRIGSIRTDNTYTTGRAGISFGNASVCFGNIVIHTAEGINAAASQTPTVTPTSSHTPTATLAPILTPISFSDGVEVTFRDDFETGTLLSTRWEWWNNKRPALENGQLVLEGGYYDTGVVRKDINANEGGLILFQYERGEIELHLDYGDYATRFYRRWGFAKYYNNSGWQAYSQYGTNGANAATYNTVDLEAGQWYYLLFRVDNDGKMHTRVWHRDDPSRFLLSVSRAPSGTSWSGRIWQFVMTGNNPKFNVEFYDELRFPTDYAMPRRPPQQPRIAVVAPTATPTPTGTPVPTQTPAVAQNGTGLLGEYYNNRNLTSLILTQVDRQINFNWGESFPTSRVGAETFSVRWTGQIQPLYSEIYIFYVTSDDGARLWVNGQRIINAWFDQDGSGERRGNIRLVAGQRYDIVLEYYDNTGGAEIQLRWSSSSQRKQIIPQKALYPASGALPAATPTPLPTQTSAAAQNGTGLRAQYYNNRDFTNLVRTELDGQINFLWGETTPTRGVSQDTFSVRWTGQIEPLYSEMYTFYTTSDDGVRLWVNGQRIINAWFDQDGIEQRGSIQLTAGQRYDIVLEYYDNTGAAQIQLRWSSSSQRKQIIPQKALYPASGALPAATPTPLPTQTSAAAQNGTGLRAQYYNNRDFTNLVRTELDGQINFLWGETTPTRGVSQDTFSVRWTGQIEPLYSEMYTFYTTSDDGVRLWVNGQRIINAWFDQDGIEQRGSIQLTAGQRYDIVLEYYDNTGAAQIQLRWSSSSQRKQIIPQKALYPASGALPAATPTPLPTQTSAAAQNGTGLRAQYYNNRDFTNLVRTELDGQINFLWGETTPTRGVSQDTFSVRWTGQIEPLYSEMYTFYTTSDDGVRLWVNGQRIINAWFDQDGIEQRGSIQLTAGQRYDIVLEYYDNTGAAQIQLRWSSSSQRKQIIPQKALYPASGALPAATPTPLPTQTSAAAQNGTGLRAQYYNNRDFTNLVRTELDGQINFLWGETTPTRGVSQDTFSVRWTGQIEPLYSEMYTFYTTSDDGVRLWVNGQRIINAWFDQDGIEQRGSIQLTAGQRYDIVLEYYDNTGAAQIQLRWSSSSQRKQIIPQKALYPASGP